MQGRDAVFEEVRGLIRERMVEGSVPSIAVAVARDGEILWEEGFGWADMEGRVEATPHTLYSLASISKPITATGVMVLAGQGKLELERPINDYLGDAGVTARVGEAEEATVRRVANHTSGLPLHYHFFPVDEPQRRPPVDETIRRYANLLWAPGEKYQYSNLGYGLLDTVIARLSGKSYADFMRTEVFLPLGMTRASVDIGTGLEPYQAIRYGPDRAPIPFYDFDHPGGSAVYCSAHDLVRFGMFHLKARLPDQKAILPDEAIDAMQVPSAESGEKSSYGIGWAISDQVEGYRVVSHGGGMLGVTTTLLLIPSERLAIAVLANTGCDLPHVAADRIAGTLLPEYGERRAAAEARRKEEREKGDAERPEFRPGPELLGTWRGQSHTYRGDLPVMLEFKESGDLHAQIGSGLKTLLNEARFEAGWLTGRMFGDIGTEDAARRPYLLHVNLKLRGGALNGALIAVSRPSNRPGNALSHWMELRRESGQSPG